MKVDINVHMYSGLEVHYVRPFYKQNDFVIGFSLQPINPNERGFLFERFNFEGPSTHRFNPGDFFLSFSI